MQDDDEYTPASKADLFYVSRSLHDKLRQQETVLAISIALNAFLIAKLVFGIKFFWE